MYIALDFDGTIVNNEFPRIGKPFTNALKVLKSWNYKHRMFLHTSRTGQALNDALKFLQSNGIDVEYRTTKPNADLYIDDKQLGGLPRKGKEIDWEQIERLVDLEQHKQNVKGE